MNNNQCNEGCCPPSAADGIDMNDFEVGEAKIKFGDADFELVKPGSFVRCAVTGKAIAVNALKYWSVDKQEAYIDADAAMVGFGYKDKA